MIWELAVEHSHNIFSFLDQTFHSANSVVWGYDLRDSCRTQPQYILVPRPNFPLSEQCGLGMCYAQFHWVSVKNVV